MPQMTQLTQQQANRVTAINENFTAVDPAALFGINWAESVGLVFAYYGGVMLVDGVQTSITGATVALSASTTNYLEATRAGVVSTNTAGFTAGRIPLGTAVTSADGITTWTDYRVYAVDETGILTKAMPSDANYTLTAAEARNRILQISGGTTLTATRNIVIPLAQKEYIVYNNAAGAQSLQFIGATGTGITVGTGKRAIIYADGTNVVRVTSDV